MTFVPWFRVDEQKAFTGSRNGYPTAGEYSGLRNRTLTIVGSPEASKRKQFIYRESIGNIKEKELAKMNMSHFSEYDTVGALLRGKQSKSTKYYSCISGTWNNRVHQIEEMDKLTKDDVITLFV